MSAQYALVPQAVIADKRCDALAIAVLTAIASFSNRQHECWPSVVTLAQCLGISRPTIHNRLKILIKCGYLKKINQYKKNGGQTSNFYKIFFDDKVPKLPPPLVKDAVQGGVKQPLNRRPPPPTPSTSPTSLVCVEKYLSREETKARIKGVSNIAGYMAQIRRRLAAQGGRLLPDELPPEERPPTPRPKYVPIDYESAFQRPNKTRA